MLHLGGSIGYWRGDIKGLVDDIAALRPTLFCGEHHALLPGIRSGRAPQAPGRAAWLHHGRGARSPLARQ